MMSDDLIFQEVPGFYRIIPLKPLRRTPGVLFDNVPMAVLPRIDAMDRVLHQASAVSPGPVGEVARPWYMHPHQDDNLIVLFGRREVDIYHPDHGRLTFTVTTDKILAGDGSEIYPAPAMLVWPRYVFHRIVSGPEGSASLNFAVHYPGLDMRTNFNIYQLDEASGKFQVIREGFRDQGSPQD
ncbi:hypothetical protein [Desulfurivibrio dismutans]|uniref:hypothetical protein n=1 Tax=Desulfurivibrio dismutans TaxID=1398908 RepID=UPI0023DB53EC|nr:hypothetical protein [Desulfurivibrio alkaliphilus]MDF1614550.1 hypothetical protein [Desulfurivibrio alkaliphilus]